MGGPGPDERHHTALLDWFASQGRDLPWRHTRDPWAILVSEFMLAQTQVARVVARFETFLDRFPTVQRCAAAPVGDVITAWAGLGYNRRAVNLHRSATRICGAHEGEVPATLDELLALPGVGPYIARAVLAFAYEHDVGVVDTNVARVLARWEGRPLTRAEVQRMADGLVPAGTAWAWNQALFDLGATVCVARSPRCDACPVRQWCGWAGRGDLADPIIGTAGTGSRQSRFAGSDRQGRGRLVDALRTGPVPAEPADLAEVMGWPDDPERAGRVAATLVVDGLAAVEDGSYRLP
jgi:A/G-specific adenine glycosylase